MAGKAGGKQAGAGGASVPGKGTPAIDGTTELDAATLDAIIDDITPDAVRAAVLAYRTAIDNAALVVDTATPPPPVDAVKQVPTIIALPILGALISHAVVDTLMLKDAKARAAVFNSLVLEQAPAAMRGLIEAGAAAVDKFYRNGRKRKNAGNSAKQ